MLLTSSVVVPTTLLWEPKIAEASLVSAEIFSNVQASNDSATSAAAPYSNPGDTNPVNFTISGSNAVTLDVLNGDKVAIVGVPKGLTGFVHQMAMPGYQQISLCNLKYCRYPNTDWNAYACC